MARLDVARLDVVGLVVARLDVAGLDVARPGLALAFQIFIRVLNHSVFLAENTLILRFELTTKELI